MRKLQEVKTKNQIRIDNNPKMFTVADGVQVAVVDLKGFKGDVSSVETTVQLAAGTTGSRGHVGLFIDGYIHPQTARDFAVDANEIQTIRLTCMFDMENDKTHIQVRVAAQGEVEVTCDIIAEELTAAPEVQKPITGPLHASLTPKVAEITKESFVAPTGEAV